MNTLPPRLFMLCFWAVVVTGCASSGVHPLSVEKARQDFSEAVGMVQKNYVTEVDVTKLVDDAIANMYLFAGVVPSNEVAAIPEEPLLRFSRAYEYLLGHSTRPLFKSGAPQQRLPSATIDQVDIGLLLTRSGEWIRISAVMIGSAAEAAGLNRGDAIIAIDGQSTSGMSLSWCYQRLGGAEGTVVEVTVNNEEGEVIDYRVVRIPIRTTPIVMLNLSNTSDL